MDLDRRQLSSFGRSIGSRYFSQIVGVCSGDHSPLWGAGFSVGLLHRTLSQALATRPVNSGDDSILDEFSGSDVCLGPYFSGGRNCEWSGAAAGADAGASKIIIH